MVYLVLPVGSLLFILFIDLLSTKSEKTERYTRVVLLNTYADVKITKKADEEEYFERLKKYDRIRNLAHYLRHPVQTSCIDRTQIIEIVLQRRGHYPIGPLELADGSLVDGIAEVVVPGGAGEAARHSDACANQVHVLVVQDAGDGDGGNLVLPWAFSSL